MPPSGFLILVKGFINFFLLIKGLLINLNILHWLILSDQLSCFYCCLTKLGYFFKTATSKRFTITFDELSCSNLRSVKSKFVPYVIASLWWIWLLLPPLSPTSLPSASDLQPFGADPGPRPACSLILGDEEGGNLALLLLLLPALFLLMDLGGPANHDPCQPTPSVHAQTMVRDRKGEKKLLDKCCESVWIKISSLAKITAASVAAAFFVPVLIS